MPGRNKTGPNAAGPMTGRGLGLCTGYDRSWNIGYYGRSGFHHGYGPGRGHAYGRGMGYRHGQVFDHYYGVAGQKLSEEEILENEVKFLKEQLTSAEKQLSDLQKQK
jgi:hypothetical protein